MDEKKRFYELDLLRFIAALAVVIYHYSFRGAAGGDGFTTFSIPSIDFISRYGYLGVDLFFLISGFVILMTAMGKSAGEFVISRLTRLYPAYWIACTLTFLVTFIFAREFYKPTITQYTLNMTMLSGYFKIEDIDHVYWSLREEIKLYAFIFLVLFLGQIKNIEKLLIGWLVVTLAAIIVNNRILLYLTAASYSSYFISGAFFFLAKKNGWNSLRFLMVILTLFLSIYLSIQRSYELAADYHTPFSPYAIGILITIFYAIFYFLTKFDFKIKNPYLIELGALTYPLYLIHQNIGYIILNWLNPRLPAIATFLIVIGLALLVSKLIHDYIEAPMMSYLRKRLNHLLQIWRLRFSPYLKFSANHKDDEGLNK